MRKILALVALAASASSAWGACTTHAQLASQAHAKDFQSRVHYYTGIPAAAFIEALLYYTPPASVDIAGRSHAVGIYYSDSPTSIPIVQVAFFDMDGCRFWTTQGDFASLIQVFNDVGMMDA